MGLDLKSFRLCEVVDVENVYVKIRDITTNKSTCSMDENDSFYLSYNAVYSKGDKVIQNKHFNFTRDTIFEAIWQECYSHLKAELTKQGIQHTDKL
jgi:hypothetical protein|tara:strand:+ start:1441 stop:1728 length:288 start_codon:yes stop_codon:yes gene_type:complete